MHATATAQRQRWTPAEEKTLMSSAKGVSGQALADVFERIARERGVSPSTVRSKYYALKKPRKNTWSARAGNQLVREASAVTGRERTRVFEQWAEKRRTSVGAIKQKYYQLAAEAKPAEPKAKPAATNGNGNGAAPAAALSAPLRSARPSGRSLDDLDGLTMLELAQLSRRVSDELERRIASVASLWV